MFVTKYLQKQLQKNQVFLQDPEKNPLELRLTIGERKECPTKHHSPEVKNAPSREPFEHPHEYWAGDSEENEFSDGVKRPTNFSTIPFSAFLRLSQHSTFSQTKGKSAQSQG